MCRVGFFGLDSINLPEQAVPTSEWLPMDIVTLLVSIAVFFFGRRQEVEGAGMPLMAAGVFGIIFGVIWVLASRTHILPE